MDTSNYYNHQAFSQSNQKFQSTSPCNLGTNTQNQNGEDHAISTYTQSLNPDPAASLTCLSFLEQKIGHLRHIICSSSNPQQQQIVSTELSCIIVQLISISRNLIHFTKNMEIMDNPAFAHRKEDTTHPSIYPHEGSDSDQAEEVDMDDEHLFPAGSYEVMQIEKEEILAPHIHFCKVCGKGFKRDANLRMHMRGHGDEYKTAAALAKPGKDSAASETAGIRIYYSCPFVGCKRNKEHKNFQPLKTAVCVKNHYRRSHCDKSYTCSRCNIKKFSVLADLRTHEKHCGRDRWVCSCGTTFSRKDKLFGHVAVFDGHTPALPPEEEDVADGTVSCQLLSPRAENRMLNVECSSEGMFDDNKSFDIRDFDDGRGYLSPVGLDSRDFAGFDLVQCPLEQSLSQILHFSYLIFDKTTEGYYKAHAENKDRKNCSNVA